MIYLDCKIINISEEPYTITFIFYKFSKFIDRWYRKVMPKYRNFCWQRVYIF